MTIMRRPPITIKGRLQQAAKEMKKEADLANRHLQKIFAPPIQTEQVEAFEPKVYVKSDKDKEFLLHILRENFLFCNLSEREIDTLINAFEPFSATAQQCLIREGDEGDYFYILQRGDVTFRVDDKVVGKAEAGSTFGELALLYAAPRAASVHCQTDCALFRLDQTTFRTTLQAQTLAADKAKLDLLKSVEVLQRVEHAGLLKLARAMTEQPFRKGDFLFHRGDAASSFYIIQQGNVNATDVVLGGSKYEDVSFGPGDSFGWFAIVKNKPWQANVQACSDGRALLIDSNTFKAVVGDVEQFLVKWGDRIMLNSVTVVRDSSLDDIHISAFVDMIVEDRFAKGFVISEEQVDTEAALYLVREGKVRVESKDGLYNKTVTSGGYFGEDLLLADHVLLGTGQPVIASKYTVTALEDCRVGILKLKELRKFVDTTVLGLGKDPTMSPIDASIRMEDLTRHVMLGAGSFGQVWLASAEGRDGTRRVYALKVQSKYQLIQDRQAEGVISEKNIMQRLCSPFIIQLVNTYQDEQRAYMLTGLLEGGELADVMYTSEYDCIGEDNAKFYAAGVLEGLDFMHQRKIIHRDLKPQNVMINSKGYPVIIDLGFSKYVPDRTFTFCGTPIYIAPEVITYQGHDKGADHWSLACMIYEMCEGENPFWEHGMEDLALFKKIVRGKFEVRGWMSVDLKILLVSMLVPNPAHRLGSLAEGSKDIYKASWFSDIDFEKLRTQEIKAPWVPDSKDPLDSSNFNDISKESWVEDKFEKEEPSLTPEEQAIFKTF